MKPKTGKGGKTVITIDGESIELTPDRVRVNEIFLDPDNPRIRYLVKSRGLTNPKQEDLQDLLFQVNGVQELVRKIRENKGTIDPIILSNGGTVIEGNCRVACYRHLGANGDTTWATIPALRLPKVGQRQIDILLSKYHVSGKINWRTYAQAGQVYKLKHDHLMSEDEIARVVGIPAKVVQHLLNTYELMTNEILPKLPGAKGLKKFSHIYEFFKSPDPEMDKWRRSPKHLKQFARWITDGTLAKGTDVRSKMPAIVRSPKTIDALNDGADSGKKILRSVGRPPEFAAIEKSLTILGDLKPYLIDRLKSDKKEQKLLKQLYVKLRDVAEMAEMELA